MHFDSSLRKLLEETSNSTTPTTGCFNNCSNVGICIGGICQCEFGYGGIECETYWGTLYWAYVIIFTVLFAFVGLVSLIQMGRFVYYDGIKPTIPKFLHFLFLLLGIGRAIWLQYDPHNLRDTANPFFENLIYGLGLYMIVFAYVLVVMLWGVTLRQAYVGYVFSWPIRHVRVLLISLLVVLLILEITFRILWRMMTPYSADYYVVIVCYYVFVCLALCTINCTFMFCGFKLHNNLKKFEKTHPEVRTRLQKNMILTLLSTALSCLTILGIVCTIILEAFFFHFDNMITFLIEQFYFRLMEWSLSALILFFLKGAPTANIGNEKTHGHAQVVVDDVDARRQMNNSNGIGNNNNNGGNGNNLVRTSSRGIVVGTPNISNIANSRSEKSPLLSTKSALSSPTSNYIASPTSAASSQTSLPLVPLEKH